MTGDLKPAAAFGRPILVLLSPCIAAIVLQLPVTTYGYRLLIVGDEGCLFMPISRQLVGHAVSRSHRGCREGWQPSTGLQRRERMCLI